MKNLYKMKFFALGGLNEVGKNCYVFETKSDIIIVDCGIKFVNNNNLADGMIPNFSYLLSNKKKIKGLFITHGHEDHIGGVIHLLDKIGPIPIFSASFTSTLLKQKCYSKKNLSFNVFNDSSVVVVGGFKLTFFRVTHSIPDSFGFIIENDGITAVVTGDFKFDWTEIGEKFDLHKVIEAGNKGVDLLLSDSTNAEVEGNTPSESKVIKKLEKIISESPGRVIMTSFASNVYRLKKVMEIAKRLDKKIVLLGSSLLKTIGAIHKSSLWSLDSSIFLKSNNIASTPNNKLIIFCTGSQGEEKAVLSRLANKNYTGWKIEKNDTVVLTSSPIMDNKFNVEIVNNKLYSLGAKIYENEVNELLHVSGHACEEDLKLLLKMVKPRFFLPFHGDYRMLKRHGIIARETGVKESNIFVCSNGDVLAFDDKNDFHLTKEKIDTEPSFVLDGKVLVENEFNNYSEIRECMSKGGVLIVILFIDKEKVSITNINLFTYGFINMQKNSSLVNNWKIKIKKFIEEMLKCVDSKQLTDNYLIIDAVKKYINEVLFVKNVQKNPLISVIIN